MRQEEEEEEIGFGIVKVCWNVLCSQRCWRDYKEEEEQAKVNQVSNGCIINYCRFGHAQKHYNVVLFLASDAMARMPICCCRRRRPSEKNVCVFPTPLRAREKVRTARICFEGEAAAAIAPRSSVSMTAKERPPQPQPKEKRSNAHFHSHAVNDWRGGSLHVRKFPEFWRRCALSGPLRFN